MLLKYATISFALFASLNLWGIDDLQKKSNNNLLSSMTQIIRVLEKEHLISNSIPEKNKKIAINSFLKNIDSYLNFYSIEEDIPNIEIYKSEPFQTVDILKSSIKYIRLDSFKKEFIEKLSEELKMYSPKLKSGIIDLRRTQGFNYDNVLVLNKLLKDKFDDKPLIIIVSNKTKGAAEIFTGYCSKNFNRLIIGEKTAGFPFKLLKVELDDGYLTVPLRPSFIKKDLIIDVIPNIEVVSFPQISPTRSLEKQENNQEDLCLLKAKNILLAKQILTQKEEK